MTATLEITMCQLVEHSDPKHPMNGWCEEHQRWGYVCNAKMLLLWAIESIDNPKMVQPVSTDCDAIDVVAKSLSGLGIK